MKCDKGGNDNPAESKFNLLLLITGLVFLLMALLSCTGGRGEIGPQGEAGLVGEQGPMGLTGPQGPQGPSGSTTLAEVTGPTGRP